MIAQLVMSKGKKPKKVNTKPFDFAFGGIRIFIKGYTLLLQGCTFFRQGYTQASIPQ